MMEDEDNEDEDLFAGLFTNEEYVEHKFGFMHEQEEEEQEEEELEQDHGGGDRSRSSSNSCVASVSLPLMVHRPAIRAFFGGRQCLRLVQDVACPDLLQQG